MKLKLEKAYRHSYAREFGSNDKDWYLDAYNVLVKVKKENPYWSPWEKVCSVTLHIHYHGDTNKWSVSGFSDEMDGIKMMSYRFGYYGEISFSEEFSTDSEGICWLEKDEYLKYSGNDEEYWNNKSLDEIEFLLGEIKAWCDKDVYGFVIGDAVRIQGIKTYYYGELDKVEGWIFEDYGLNKEEFEEVA